MPADHFGLAWAGKLRRFVLLLGVALPSWAVPVVDDAAAVLNSQHTRLRAQLAQNVFQHPLVLQSSETAHGLQGDVYAEMAFAFEAVSAALRQPDQWCEVMILHINTKYCRATSGSAGALLTVNIGTKTPQELAQSARLAFSFSVLAATPEYFEVLLDAADGPLGTSDYRIRLQAIALPQQRTFLHLTYAYSVNLLGRLAMQTYLATAGANKVGFTLINSAAGAPPVLIDGVRGLVERNTMRYYLAIDSYFQTAPAGPAAQFEQRLQSWFTATEAYPRQLHETDRPAYLEMKHAEHTRQQTSP
jgi:hypothetical protein